MGEPRWKLLEMKRNTISVNCINELVYFSPLKTWMENKSFLQILFCQTVFPSWNGLIQEKFFTDRIKAKRQIFSINGTIKYDKLHITRDRFQGMIKPRKLLWELNSRWFWVFRTNILFAFGAKERKNTVCLLKFVSQGCSQSLDHDFFF